MLKACQFIERHPFQNIVRPDSLCFDFIIDRHLHRVEYSIVAPRGTNECSDSRRRLYCLIICGSQDCTSFNHRRRCVDSMIRCLDYHDLNYVLAWCAHDGNTNFLDSIIPWVQASGYCDYFATLQRGLGRRLLTGSAVTTETALICYSAR